MLQRSSRSCILTVTSPLVRTPSFRLQASQHRSFSTHPSKCFAAPAAGVVGSVKSLVDDLASLGDGSRGQARLSNVAFGSIFSSSSSTSARELIDAIKITSDLQSTQVESASLLVLLLTPSLAGRTSLSSLPLQVLERLQTSATGRSKTLDAVVAVVDRLPDPKNRRSGSEGLAYFYAPSPEKPFVASQIALQRSAQKPGSINFDLEGDAAKTTIQLPLAQTIFSTGLPSTLLHARFESTNGDSILKLASEKQLESQDIALPFDGASKYYTPLIPLTPARPVASSMGNIVRKLLPHTWQTAMQLAQLGGTHETPETRLAASQELETAVSKYFEVLDLPPAPVQVWALIVPALRGGDEMQGLGPAGKLLAMDTAAITEAWATPANPDHAGREVQSATSQAVMSLLRKGARLCKVLSGGGGWGKKAGLVSLDPDLEYSTRELRGDSGWDFSFADSDTDLAVLQQQREALGEMVNDGDSLMFFLCPAPGEDSVAVVRKGERRNRKTPEDPDELPRFVEFGTIPSTIDEMSHADTTPSDEAIVRHHANVFGVLSEAGMAWQRTTDGVFGTVQNKSKLDVPFGALTIKFSSPRPD